MSQVTSSIWEDVVTEVQQIERSLPEDDIWASATSRDLTSLLIDMQSTILPAQRETLLRATARITRQANTEIMAALQADLVLRKAALR